MLQTFLLECGFSEENTGVFFSVTKILQVLSILLLSHAAERVRRVGRTTALLFLGALPLTFFLFATGISPALLSGGGTVLLYATSGIFCVAIGAYSILSYKLPYTIMDMRDYGRITGLSSAIGGGASLLASLLLTLLTGAVGYFLAMRGAYLLTAILAILTVLVTLSLREHAPPPTPERTHPTKLFAYRPFTRLILPNLLRGFATGVVAMAVTVGYAAGLLDAESAGTLVVITGAVSLLGAFFYAAIAGRVRAGVILLVSGGAAALLLPLSVAFGSTNAYLALYGIMYFFIVQVDHAVPVAVTRFVDYDMISRYTGGRMLLHTLGTSLSGLVSVWVCHTLGALALMLTAGGALLFFALFYFFYLKKLKL